MKRARLESLASAIAHGGSRASAASSLGPPDAGPIDLDPDEGPPAVNADTTLSEGLREFHVEDL